MRTLAERRADEPYSGVSALFNGDLHLGLPEWAPREDWIVLDSKTIKLSEDSNEN